MSDIERATKIMYEGAEGVVDRMYNSFEKTVKAYEKAAKIIDDLMEDVESTISAWRLARDTNHENNA